MINIEQRTLLNCTFDSNTMSLFTISSLGFLTSQPALRCTFASRSPWHLDLHGRRFQTLLVTVAKFPSAFLPRGLDHSPDSINAWKSSRHSQLWYEMIKL